MESTKRSLAKAVSYRCFGTLTTAGIVFAVVGKTDLAAAVGVADTLCKIAVYVMHERAWNKISFGRETPPEYTI